MSHLTVHGEEENIFQNNINLIKVMIIAILSSVQLVGENICGSEVCEP